MSASLRHITKRFGETVALNDVSVEIENGTVHCLAGPNGSGKSTMLGILNGRLSPTSGEVEISTSTLGMGFQSAQIYMDITVRENLNVFTDMMNADQEWVDYLIEKLRLETEMHRKGKALSGGNAKKVDLTLAFMKKPGLILLDEPLTDLDDATRFGLKEIIREYPNDERCIVIASHNLEELQDVVTDMTLIERGEIIRHVKVDDATEDLWDIYREEIIT